jgi:phosphodiesterase/alkaline phosphatase D-like protein
MEKTIVLKRGEVSFPKIIIIPKDDAAISIIVKLDGVDLDVSTSFMYSHNGVAADAIPLLDAAGDAVTLAVAAVTGEAGIMLTDLLAPYVHCTFAVTGTAPVIASITESAIDQNNATIGAAITTNSSITEVTVEYGLTNAYGSVVTAAESPIDAGASPVTISAVIAGLVAETEYHYRIKAINAKGTTVSADGTFTTLAAVAPTIATETESSITRMGVTITADVTPNGAATAVSIQYGLTTGYGTTVVLDALPAGVAAVEVTTVLTGLLPGTAYHYRVVATNVADTTNGTDQTFTTTAAAAPTVTGEAAKSITNDIARIIATVTPNGQSTTVRVEYGLTTGYGTVVQFDQSPMAAGIVATIVLARLTGLVASTTYHYRVVAINTAGTTNGSDKTFATTA